MAKPAKTLKNISVGGETYKICPVMLQDGSTNYIATLPTLTADSTIALTSNLTNRVKYDDTMMETNPFGGQKLYINTLYNAFANADKKFYVTITKHKKSDSGVTYPYTDSSKTIEDDNYYVDGPVVATLTTSAHNLFNGSYEDSINLDNDGSTYLKIRIMFGSNTSPSASSSYFLGYPYGYWYISYYYNNTPNTAAQVRVYNKYAAHTKGWHLYTASWWKGSASSQNVIQLVSDTMDYQRTCVDFIIYGNNTSGRTVNVTQIDYKLQRPNLARDGSTLTKFGPMDLYENFTWYQEHKKTLQIGADGTITGYNSSGTTKVTIAGSSGNITTAGKITADGNIEAGVFKENNILLTDKYVRADTNAQGLTDVKKANARTNIEAKQIPFEAIENTDYVYNSSIRELTNLSNEFKTALQERRDFSYTAYIGVSEIPAKLLMRYKGEGQTEVGTLLEYTSEARLFTDFIQYVTVILYSGGSVVVELSTTTIPHGLVLDSTTGELGLHNGDDEYHPYGPTVESSDIVNAGVPTHSSSDAGKVLSIDSNGDLTWNDGISGPMIFKGTLGTGGTITTLPAASASNVGYTYKVITAGTYQSIAAKVGDLFVSTAGSNSTYSWTLVPAGDELTDVQINGTSIVNPSTNIANFSTQTAYDASINKIATMQDVENASIPTINIAESQIIDTNPTIVQLTLEQFNFLNSNSCVYMTSFDGLGSFIYKQTNSDIEENNLLWFTTMAPDYLSNRNIEYFYYFIDKSDYKLYEYRFSMGKVSISQIPSQTDITVGGLNYTISTPENYIASASANGNTLTLTPNSGSNVVFTPTFTEQYTGTVTSVRVQASDCITSSQSTAQSVTLNTTIKHSELNTSGAKTTAGLYNIKIDKYGHITEATIDNNVVHTSNTSGLIKNDGTIDTNTYYLASNPNGYTNNVGTVTKVNNTSPDASGNVTIDIPTPNYPVTDVKIGNTSIVSSKVATLQTNSTYDASTNKLATMTDVNKKLDKLTYEWNKEVAMGSTGYVKIGSFPMYDTNITIDIDATTSTSYHGTAIVVTQNTSTSSMGSAHKVDVYGDPTGIIASSLRVVWTSGSRNYDIYFVPQSWSKNVIHIRAVALAAAPNESTICQKITSGTAPTTTSGISINNILNVKDVQVNGTSVAGSGVVNLITNSAYNASSNKIATMSDIPTDTNTTTDLLSSNKQLNSWSNNNWTAKTWTGLTSFYGSGVWTDGINIYYSYNENQYVLDKLTSTWSAKTWNSLTSFNGSYIWTDGDNIYYSNTSSQYVLNKQTSTWSTKTWTGLTSFDGNRVWTDGTNIYYSNTSNQYILNKSTSTWSAKTWSGLTSFSGSNIWTDGDNIYYSSSSNQYVLDKSTSTWKEKTWNGLTNFIGQFVWTDGDNIYYSYDDYNYILDKITNTWIEKFWYGRSALAGTSIWTDGTNIYYSGSSEQYILNKNTQSNPSCKTKLGYDYETQIVNKPNLSIVATSGSYNDLSDKPSIPSFPPYDSLKANYVLSIDNNGELVWKAPYSGTASGS